MNETNAISTKPTIPVTQPTGLPADQAKRPFVPPKLTKQGKVADITQGAGFGSDQIDPNNPNGP